jgi:transposase
MKKTQTVRRNEINDPDWAGIADKLPTENSGKGRPSKSNRMMLNGMLFRAKTGIPWRDLPERYGLWKTVYTRFRLWNNDNVFQKIFESLSADADMQDISVDSTSCKAHKHSAGAKKGLKNTKQTKI